MKEQTVVLFYEGSLGNPYYAEVQAITDNQEAIDYLKGVAVDAGFNCALMPVYIGRDIDGSYYRLKGSNFQFYSQEDLMGWLKR